MSNNVIVFALVISCSLATALAVVPLTQRSEEELHRAQVIGTVVDNKHTECLVEIDGKRWQTRDMPCRALVGEYIDVYYWGDYVMVKDK